ncbi:MAG: acylphosphatase [Deltaproteobacteria bacterium]|nr:MAG: acylphosphatase [Deltaproteobacteria bacterium]RLB74810.1 MAG: acylphosphatase [Deltaproteobacteria bacterium]
MAVIRAEVRVTGRVQGVWFRQSTKNMADQHGVTGWCRNNPDGSVEAVFEGEEDQVKSAVDWCKTGPRLARIDDLKVEWLPAAEKFVQFTIR